MFIDSHCHLNFKEFNDDLPLVIENARKAHVEKIIVPGASVETSRKAVQLAGSFPGKLYASVGCHPYEVMTYPRIGELEDLIRANADTIVAVGECGLDYHPYEGFDAVGKKMEQKMLFEEQLLLALKYDLPVIIHCRDAFDEIFSVIDTLPSFPRGVFHCFTGGLADVREIVKRNLLIGFDGNITYGKKFSLVIPEIDPAHIILETDAPWLTPIPHRGTRNEPKYIPLIAKKIAEFTHTDLSVIEEITTKNAQSLFRLP